MEVTKLKNEKRKITFLTRLAYGSGNLIGSGALAISGAWLLYFYTTFCNLPVAKAASIFSICTILQGFFNPLMGIITDGFYANKLGKRFGRRRFFILLGIPLTLIYPLLWIVGQSYWYYLSLYILYQLTYTIIMIPYETLAIEMTNSFDERNYLTGFKAMFGKIANFIAAALPGIFFTVLGKNSPFSFFFTALTYMIIMILALIFLFFNSWERPIEEVNNKYANTLLEKVKQLVINIVSTFRLKVFRVHIGMYLFGFGAEWLFTGTFTYYIVFVLRHSSTSVSGLNSLSSLLQLVSTAIFMVICAKKGFSKPYIFGLSIVVIAMLCFVGVYIGNINNFAIVILIMVFFGIGTGGVYYIPWSLYTFIADVDEALTGERREGTYSGAMMLVGQIMQASVIFLLGLFLQHCGFKEGVTTQPLSAVHAIVGVLLIGVVGMAIIGQLFAHKLKLDKESHKIVIEEVKRRKAGGKPEDVEENTKKIIEELTGFSYEKCFGNNTVAYKHKSI